MNNKIKAIASAYRRTKAITSAVCRNKASQRTDDSYNDIDWEIAETTRRQDRQEIRQILFGVPLNDPNPYPEPHSFIIQVLLDKINER